MAKSNNRHNIANTYKKDSFIINSVYNGLCANRILGWRAEATTGYIPAPSRRLVPDIRNLEVVNIIEQMDFSVVGENSGTFTNLN